MRQLDSSSGKTKTKEEVEREGTEGARREKSRETDDEETDIQFKTPADDRRELNITTTCSVW